jgi:hypothetical protein
LRAEDVRGFVGSSRVGDARGVGGCRGHGRDGGAPFVLGALHVEGLRGLLLHRRADCWIVPVVAVEEGMAVGVHLRDGRATADRGLLHVRHGRGERGADDVGAAGRALVCWGWTGRDGFRGRGGNCQLSAVAREKFGPGERLGAWGSERGDAPAP